MKKQNASILERVSEIEKKLQALMLKCFFVVPEKQKKEFRFYEDRDIVNTVRKIRKTLWGYKICKGFI